MKREALSLAGVVLVAWTLQSALGAALGAGGLALGSDPALWGLTARNLTSGVASYVPPLYSWLIGLTDIFVAEGLVGSGQWVSELATIALAAAIYGAARRFGAERAMAFGAALFLCALPDLLIFGLQVQPEALTALLLVGAPLVVSWFLDHPSLRRGAGLAGYGLLTYACREHGAVLIGIFFLLALAAPGSNGLRAARAAVVGVTILCAPVVGLSPPALPWDSPWAARVAVATELKETFPDALATSARAQAELTEHKSLHNRRNIPGIAWFHTRKAVSNVPLGWAWVVVGAASSLLLSRNRRFAVLVALAPVLPTLPILSQPRHVMVVVPVALVAVAAALGSDGVQRWRRPLRLALGLSVAALAIVGVRQWRGHLMPVVENVARAKAERIFGQQICQMARPGDLVAGDTFGYQIYCPMRRHRVTQVLSDADWRTISVGPTAPAPYWQRGTASLQVPTGNLYTWVLAPWIPRSRRPCQNAQAPDDAPYIALGPTPVALEPACGGASNLSLVVGRHQ